MHTEPRTGCSSFFSTATHKSVVKTDKSDTITPSIEWQTNYISSIDCHGVVMETNRPRPRESWYQNQLLSVSIEESDHGRVQPGEYQYLG